MLIIKENSSIVVILNYGIIYHLQIMPKIEVHIEQTLQTVRIISMKVKVFYVTA